MDRRVSNRRDVGNGDRGNGSGGGSGDARDVVMRAAGLGRLDKAQTKALTDLLSRTGLLGFDSRRIISVMVTNIALEDSREKRKEIVLQLREYLEGDGLAKDLVPVLSGAFKLK